MTAVSAADVKRLREKTGAGMMECKNALVENDGDFAKAEKSLKEKGLAAIEKRSGRATNEGRIFIKIAGNTAVLAELTCETDFVAKNGEFIAVGGLICDKALDKGYTEVNDELSGLLKDLATKIRENMALKQIRLVKAGEGEYLTSYIHDGVIGVIVKCSADKPEIFQSQEAKDFAFTLALHIAAFNPMALDRGGVDAGWLKEQEGIYRKQMETDEKMKDKKPEQIDRILEGKVSKLLKDICLLDQAYVKDDKVSVKTAIEEEGRQLGAKLSIADYVYVKLGA
jgi:elongation factor Ts